jgi:hypothetical protein
MKPKIISLVSFGASAFIAAGLGTRLGSSAPAPGPAHDRVILAQDDSAGAPSESPDNSGVSNQDDTDNQSGDLQNNNPDGSDAAPDSAQQPDDAEPVPPPETNMQPPDTGESGDDSSAQQQQSNDNPEEEGKPSAGDEN